MNQHAPAPLPPGRPDPLPWLRPEPVGGVSLRKAGVYTEVWIYFGNVEYLVIRELSDNQFHHEISAEGIRGVIEGKRPHEEPKRPAPQAKGKGVKP